MFLILLYLDFDGFKALAIDTDDAALADEGAWVYHLDESDDEHTLALLCQETDDLHLLARVPSVTVEDGQCVVGLARDGFGYLLVVLGENHKLYRLALYVHHVVYHSTLDDHRA